jgi:hypothetical protein
MKETITKDLIGNTVNFNKIARNKFRNIQTSWPEDYLSPVALLVPYIVISLFIIRVSDCNKDEEERLTVPSISLVLHVSLVIGYEY